MSAVTASRLSPSLVVRKVIARLAALVTGVVVAGTVLLVTGLGFGLSGCGEGIDGETTSAWLCHGGRPLMDVLEALMIGGGPLAALLGGLVTAATGRWRAWAYGMATAVLCIPITLVLLDARVTTGTLS